MQICSKMQSLSLDAMIKLSKTTAPQKLVRSDCFTLYSRIQICTLYKMVRIHDFVLHTFPLHVSRIISALIVHCKSCFMRSTSLKGLFTKKYNFHRRIRIFWRYYINICRSRVKLLTYKFDRKNWNWKRKDTLYIKCIIGRDFIWDLHILYICRYEASSDYAKSTVKI